MLEWLVEVELPVLTPSFITTTEPTYWGATPRLAAKVWANMKSLLCDIHESHCLHQAFNRNTVELLLLLLPNQQKNRSWFNFRNTFITQEGRTQKGFFLSIAAFLTIEPKSNLLRKYSKETLQTWIFIQFFQFLSGLYDLEVRFKALFKVAFVISSMTSMIRVWPLWPQD